MKTKIKRYSLLCILVQMLLINIVVYAQQKSKISFLIGANINNPHQLIENSNNPNDVNEQKSMGNIYVSLCYKNRIQLMLSNEIPELSVQYLNNDVLLGSRIYFLKDTLKLKPYFDIGILINSYGNNTYNNEGLFGANCGIGIIYKLNKYVYLDVGMNYKYKQFKYQILARPTNSPIELTIDRFMVKTGLIFKVF